MKQDRKQDLAAAAPAADCGPAGPEDAAAAAEARAEAAEARAGEVLARMTAQCEAEAETAAGLRRALATARQEIARRDEELALLTAMLEESGARLAAAQARLQAIEHSASWKLTGPVRRLRRLAGGGAR